MTKRELNKYLDLKEIEAIKKAEEDCDKELEECKQKFFTDSGLRAAVGRFTEQRGFAIRQITHCFEKNSVRCHNYSNSPLFIMQQLDTMKEDELLEYLYRSAIVTDDLPFKLKNKSKRSTLKEKINDNYDIIRQNLKCCNTKEAIAYLKSLGFDTDKELNDQETSTALIAPVDIRLLYINR